VCIMELRDGDSACLLPRCGHRFHADYVGAWLRLHATCSLCRASVVVPRSTSANSDTLGHDSATARYAYRVRRPSMFRFTIPTSRFTCADTGSTARRVDAPVRVSSLISVSTLCSWCPSSASLKMESAGVMQDPTTTTSPVATSTFANPDTLGHGSATARYAYRVRRPSMFRFTIPTRAGNEPSRARLG
jgi:hypothetical protein